MGVPPARQYANRPSWFQITFLKSYAAPLAIKACAAVSDSNRIFIVGKAVVWRPLRRLSSPPRGICAPMELRPMVLLFAILSVWRKCRLLPQAGLVDEVATTAQQAECRYDRGSRAFDRSPIAKLDSDDAAA